MTFEEMNEIVNGVVDEMSEELDEVTKKAYDEAVAAEQTEEQ